MCFLNDLLGWCPSGKAMNPDQEVLGSNPLGVPSCVLEHVILTSQSAGSQHFENLPMQYMYIQVFFFQPLKLKISVENV